MITDPTEIKQRAAVAAMANTRAPEIYIQDGEDKVIRILKGPIAQIRQYTVPVDGKFKMFTAPSEEEDLFAEAGLRSSLKFIYKIIDYAGYEDRKGVAHKNVVRYWVVGQRLWQQLTKVAEKSGMPLSRFDLTVSRSGKKTNTTYQLLPSAPSPLSDKAKAAIEKAPKLEEETELSKYYAPISAKEQVALLKKANLR